jgi:hypothetical protein
MLDDDAYEVEHIALWCEKADTIGDKDGAIKYYKGKYYRVLVKFMSKTRDTTANEKM